MELSINDKLPYGKYQGATIKQLLEYPFKETDVTRYLNWWVKTVNQYPLSYDVQKEIATQISSMNTRISNIQREKEREDMLYKEKYPEKKSRQYNYNRAMDDAIWNNEVYGMDIWSSWD